MDRTSRAIWKFQLEITDLQTIEMPEGAVVLTAQVQHGCLCVWASVNPDEPRVKRQFAVYSTGYLMFDAMQSYVGTVQIHGGSLIFHVFDLGVLSPESQGSEVERG